MSGLFPVRDFSRLARRILLLAAIALAVFSYRDDTLLFERPSAWEQHYALKLGSVLDKDGLYAVFPFDEAVIREPVRHGACGSEQTQCVPGLIGNARSFCGSNSAMIWTGVKWRDLGDAYSISMWVKIRNTSPTQAIMWWTGGSQKTGLMLVHGRMAFAVPGRASSVTISYPFEDYDRYAFITAVVDRGRGFARLYQDGELRAEGSVSAVEQPNRYVVFGKMSSLKIGYPFCGELDETALWSRALSAEEVRQLHRRRRPLVADSGGRYAFKYRAAAAVRRVLRALPCYLELFNPFLHSSHLEALNLPVCDIILSGDDQRWFNSQHAWYLKNRALKDDARRSRRVRMVLDGRAADVRMSLFYPPAMTSACHRMSYVVKLDSDITWRGMHSFVLLAPEDYGMLVPLLETALSQNYGLYSHSDGIAVLRLNRSVRGAYYFADYAENSFGSIHRGLDAGRLIQSIPADRRGILDIYDGLKDRYSPAFADDTLNGVSARETRFRIAYDRQTLEEWLDAAASAPPAAIGSAAALLGPQVIKGANPSLMYIVTNLPLGEIEFPNMNLKWVSTRPDIIDEQGRVSRPAGSEPVAVELSLRLKAAGAETSRVYEAAVQPQRNSLPLVQVKAPDFPNNMYRIPCVAGISGHEEILPESPGEIRIRGNSAIRYPKKSFSIALDRPHGVFGDTDSRHLYLVGCGKDPSLIRNKLAYELFRDFGSEAAPRIIPRVEMVELILNGEYLGIYQLTQRVDRHMLGWKAFNSCEQHHNVLYKADGPGAGFLEVHQDQYEQKEPDEVQCPCWEPYSEIIRFIAESSPEEFRAHVAEHMDIANIVDFHLFLLLTNNRDGNNHNLYLAREGTTGSRFFIIPWDYDTAFMDDGFLSNGLFERLEADLPGYPGMLKERWVQLRQGICDKQAIFDRIDAMHAENAPAVEREKIGEVPGAKRRDAAVRELKAWISARLLEVDRHLASMP